MTKLKRTLTVVAVTGLVLLAGVAAASAARKPNPKTPAAYRACLAKHGAGFFGTGKRPTAAQLKKLQPALKACAAQRPTGGGGSFGGPGGRPFTAANGAAFKKYTDCLKKHGVTFTPGQRPRGGTPPARSAKFKAANAACASLRPKRPAAPAGG